MRSLGPPSKVPYPSMASLIRSPERVSLGFRVELLPVGVFRYLSVELVVRVLRPLEKLLWVSISFPVLTNQPWGSLSLLMKNFKLKKMYATTVAGFGGVCYNKCAGSYLSSYCSPATNLLLIFIQNSIYLTKQILGNSAKNVGCYYV